MMQRHDRSRGEVRVLELPARFVDEGAESHRQPFQLRHQLFEIRGRERGQEPVLLRRVNWAMHRLAAVGARITQ